MPPLSREPIGWFNRLIGYAIFLTFASGFVWTLWRWPIPTTVMTVALAVWLAVMNRRIRQSIRRLGKPRTGETICTFARALPIREVDTWVVRAAFEQLQEHLRADYVSFPLRPSDRLVDDLKIDPDDVDLLASDIAQRAGRTLIPLDKNPYWGRVASVEDLIRAVCAQPRSVT